MNKENLNALKNYVSQNHNGGGSNQLADYTLELIEAYEKLANREPDWWHSAEDYDREGVDSPQNILRDIGLCVGEICEVVPVYMRESKYAVDVPIGLNKNGDVADFEFNLFDTREEAEQAVEEPKGNE